MKILADLEFLGLELQGLAKECTIGTVKGVVNFKGDTNSIRLKIAHLKKVKVKANLYTDLEDKCGDTNAYMFHSL